MAGRLLGLVQQAGKQRDAAIARIASAAGRIVSSGDSEGPRPANISTPSTATATKFAALLIVKNDDGPLGDLRDGHPALAQRPGAERQAAGPAGGTSDPTASSERPSSVAERQVIRSQKTGRNITT